MDYIFFTTLLAAGIATVVLSYDIACSWSVNLFKRFKAIYTARFWINAIATIAFVFLVPKLHCPTHGIPCRTIHALDYHPGVGRTHGETIEQIWGHIGGLRTSIREMGPYARQFTLDDHWSGWNHVKRVTLGECALVSDCWNTRLTD